MFWGFVTCKDAKGCNGIGGKWASGVGGANFCKASLPANGEHESSVLEKVLDYSCRCF